MSTLTKRWGNEGGRRVALRLQQLAAVACLDDMRHLPGRCHELSADRKGQFSLDLCQPYRLVFEPTEQPPPTKSDGGIDWTAVASITVIDILDTHD